MDLNAKLIMTKGIRKAFSQKLFEKSCLCAKETGLDVIYVDSIEEAGKYYEKGHIIFGSLMCLMQLEALFSRQIGKNFILFNNQLDAIHMTNNKKTFTGLRYIIGEIEETLLFKLLRQIFSFYKQNSLADIRDHFKHSDFLAFDYTLRNSSDRNRLRDEVTQFFNHHVEKNQQILYAWTSGHIKTLADALEEFLMNAIWDANPERQRLDRTKPFDLLTKESVYISCLFDGDYFLLSVQDQFGTFKTSAIEKIVLKIFGLSGMTKIKTDVHGGAGIGLHMILQKIGVVIFEVEKEHMTRASVIIPCRQSMRDIQKKTRTLLFFEK